MHAQNEIQTRTILPRLVDGICDYYYPDEETDSTIYVEDAHGNLIPEENTNR